MSWESYDRAVEKGPMAIFWKILLLVIAISVIVGVINFVAIPLIQGKRIVEKTLDADNVIYNYEWFKRQFRAVNAIDKKIALQQEAVTNFEKSAGPRKEWTFEDKTEHARISSIVTGLGQQRADMVAEYNARANMANREIFMGKDCPAHIN